VLVSASSSRSVNQHVQIFSIPKVREGFRDLFFCGVGAIVGVEHESDLCGEIGLEVLLVGLLLSVLLEVGNDKPAEEHRSQRRWGRPCCSS
jgi:hypothetical protein